MLEFAAVLPEALADETVINKTLTDIARIGVVGVGHQQGSHLFTRRQDDWCNDQCRVDEIYRNKEFK